MLGHTEAARVGLHDVLTAPIPVKRLAVADDYQIVVRLESDTPHGRAPAIIAINARAAIRWLQRAFNSGHEHLAHPGATMTWYSPVAPLTKNARAPANSSIRPSWTILAAFNSTDSLMPRFAKVPMTWNVYPWRNPVKVLR